MVASFLVDRNDVIAMFPGMNLRKFKRTRLYKLLKIHEHRENAHNVFYDRSKLNRTLKLAGYDFNF